MWALNGIRASSLSFPSGLKNPFTSTLRFCSQVNPSPKSSGIPFSWQRTHHYWNSIPPLPKRYFSQSSPIIPPQGGPVQGRFKTLYKTYGKPALFVYFAISTVDLGLSYIAVSNGVEVDKYTEYCKTLIEDWGLWKFEEEMEETLPETTEKNGGKKSILSTFLIAYAFHKLLVPIRVPLTIALTPPFVRFLRRWGWLLPAK
jgi:hypothetical protein